MSEKFYLVTWEDKDGEIRMERINSLQKAIHYDPPNSIPYSARVWQVKPVEFDL